MSDVYHRTFDIRATGSTAAVQLAKDMARADGFRVRTVVRVDQLERHVRDNRREILRWRVTLAIRS